MKGILAQIWVIGWAQFRTMRNHLPRTSAGTMLAWLLLSVWYGVFAGLGFGLAVWLPQISVAELRRALPAGLLGVFLFWQIVPLFTLGSGWSLQLNKLRMYPVRDSALFDIEILLRLTGAPEMVLVLLGGFIGLLRHPDVPLVPPFCLLLFLPFNLFLALAIRELFLQSFARNRMRELFAIGLVSIALLPQLFLRTKLGHIAQPYWWLIATGRAAPWEETASLSLGAFSADRVLLLAIWMFLAYQLARRQFAKSLVEEEGVQPATAKTMRGAGTGRARESLLQLPGRVFGDPMAALLEKEFRSLLRMPRFRVLFGMACVFTVVVLIPAALESHGRAFMRLNLLPIADLYGLLILSDSLLLNVFGFDRKAAQIYFVTPVSLATVLKAKNFAAIAFILVQAAVAVIVTAALHMTGGVESFVNALGATAVVGLFFLSAGNLISIGMPRPTDPTQTFRKQPGAKMQLWFLLCSVGMMVLMGFAFLAQWALESYWALLGVLALEFVIGLIVYRVALDSAADRGGRERERILDALSKGASPVGSGL